MTGVWGYYSQVDELNRTEPDLVEHSWTEPNRIEPNRTELNTTEQNRTEPSRK